MSQKETPNGADKNVSLLVAYAYPNPKARHRPKRVGRGQGSGLGKTCGRGSKGQLARSGGSIHPRFEGGQMPLQRRLPKRGFYNLFRTEYQLVKVHQLNRFAEGTTVGPDEFVAAGLIKKRRGPVKILSNGELTRSLIVIANKVTRQAREKIEQAGGEVKLIE